MPYIVDLNIPFGVVSMLENTDKVYFSMNIPSIYEPVNTHPDIQIHFISKNSAYCLNECYEYYRKTLPESVNLIKLNNNTGKNYPENVPLNIAAFGKYVICNKKYAAKEVQEYYENNSYEIISVKQGYSKCNVCIVSDNAIITEDTGIYKKIKSCNLNLDVCLIKPSGVSLKNFDYGFIGGASGILDDNTIGFIGNIELHPEFDKINSFLKAHNKTYKSLGSGSLSDFGSIIQF